MPNRFLKNPRDIIRPSPEAIQPLAIEFARMMFEHAMFEQEVALLQNAITNDDAFGNQRRNQWGAKERPKKMAELIEKHLGAIPETEEIVKLLTRAQSTCERRDFLVHGFWWYYNSEKVTITVRGGSWKDGQPQVEDFSQIDISVIAGEFIDLMSELYKRRSEIESRLGRHKVDESDLPT
jgi:hypothetical protein